MSALRLWIPLVIFGGFCVLGAYHLSSPKNDFVTSAMIGKPVPQFTLEAAYPDRPGFSSKDLADGEPKLLNIWASWCLPCIAESPNLERLQQQGVPIYGVAIRDRPEDVARFLAQNGNPYRKIGADNLSQVQLGIGSSGVPETFVIDGKGVITYQLIGDIRANHVPILLNELEKAR